MTGIEVTEAAKLLWQVVARIPWLRLLLRRFGFPLQKCRTKFRVSVSGAQAGFELKQVRPAPALRGVTIEIYNPLPFAVSFTAYQAIVSIDSAIITEPVLNSPFKVPAAGFATLSLPELSLAERVVDRIPDSYCRIKIELRWHCSSVIHEWHGSGAYELVVSVQKDSKPAIN